jgi:hypothetical protein
MRTWIAILFTIGLVTACGLLGKNAGTQAYLCLIIGTSIWVGIDSFKINLIKYKSGIAYQPEVLGILCAMFWFVCFPWYLSVRYKIRKGTAVLREEFKSWALTDAPMGPNELIQPWRGRALTRCLSKL